MKKEIRISDEFFSATSVKEAVPSKKKRTGSESEAMGVILGTAPKKRRRTARKAATPKAAARASVTSTPKPSSTMDSLLTRAICLPFVLARSAMDCWTSVIRNTLED